MLPEEVSTEAFKRRLSARHVRSRIVAAIELSTVT